MKVKKLVKRGRQYVEEYVDQGPGRARAGHGAPMRMVNNQRVGPLRSLRVTS